MKIIFPLKFMMLLTTLVLVATHSSCAFSETRIRKNIDDLSQTELEIYLHALKKLNDMAPNQVGSFSYFAALHNRPDVGPCEHARDTFLPWHRAHLIKFEDALRAADPPKTSNVTIPYWNWSELPTGERYPQAFESETVLQPSLARNATPICRPGIARQCQNLPWPWSYLENQVLSVNEWSSNVDPGKGFGGNSDGNLVCNMRQDQGYGAIESPAHNLMHDGYIDGLMANPSTAARDPIFYSFHAFLDLLWDEWQSAPGNAVDTCLNCQLCGLNVKVEDVMDSSSQLSVDYDFTRPSLVTSVAPGFRVKPHVPYDLAYGATEKPIATEVIQIVIPNKPQSSYSVVIQGANIRSPRTYQINAYFYPASGAVEYKPASRDFRQQYMVYLNSIWMAHHSGHSGQELTQDFTIDLSRRINELVETQAGESWLLTVDTLLSPLEQQGVPMRVQQQADDLIKLLQIDGLRLFENGQPAGGDDEQ